MGYYIFKEGTPYFEARKYIFLQNLKGKAYQSQADTCKA